MIDADKKALPIGNINFKQIIAEDNYYVDKTDMIRDIIDYKIPVSLFTRPRRFGKTLNMDMLRTFFEKTEQDNSVYFKNLKIWQYGEKYTSEQGKYPVIYFSFKEIKCLDWKSTCESLFGFICEEFCRHMEVAGSCGEYENSLFDRIINSKATQTDYEQSLRVLSKMLAKYYNTQVIIIIDEYDTPIQSGYMRDFFTQIVSFMRNFFTGGFKDNLNLKFGFMTGILRVAKENIFSGLNNLRVYSILDNDFSEYFGFTETEVDEMMEYYGYTDKLPKIKKWYDGYIFGESEIYNPWSLLNSIRDKCKLSPYWVNTSSNDIIRDLIRDADDKTAKNLHLLYEGKTISSSIDTAVTFPELQNSPNAVLSFLAISGYLKAKRIINEVEEDDEDDEEERYYLSIPNKELKTVYKKEVIAVISERFHNSFALQIGDALFDRDIEEFGRLLQKFMLQSMSYFDASEAFYHGLILGICAIMTSKYKVESNRESGFGRFDVALFPLKTGLPSYIFELKLAKEGENLDELAKIGLEQIEKKEYITEFANMNITDIQKIGIAFRGKETAIIQK